MVKLLDAKFRECLFDTPKGTFILLKDHGNIMGATWHSDLLKDVERNNATELGFIKDAPVIGVWDEDRWGDFQRYL